MYIKSGYGLSTALIFSPIFLNLFLGLLGGASRMGLFPGTPLSIVSNHGALMLMGFISALIAVERGMTLKDLYAKAAAILFQAGGLFLVAGIKFAAYFSWFSGSVSFLFWAFKYLFRFRGKFSSFLFVYSACMLFAGVVFYVFGFPASFYVFCWAAFVVCFVCGERMDMLQIRNPRKDAYFAVFASIPFSIMAVINVQKEFMSAFFAALLFAVMPQDLGLKMYRKPGFSKFFSVGLMTSYFWLGVSAFLWVVDSAWDSMLHVVFLGFVGSMIFTHAPIAIPAIMRMRHFYSWHLYIPFTILQASIAIRLVSAGFIRIDTWVLSGWMALVAVVAYVVIAASNVWLKKF